MNGRLSSEKQLNTDRLRLVARLGRPFPTSAGRLQRIARREAFDGHSIELLASFPSEERFQSESDFLTRTEDLAILESEEAEMPEERLSSPQD